MEITLELHIYLSASGKREFVRFRVECICLQSYVVGREWKWVFIRKN